MSMTAEDILRALTAASDDADDDDADDDQDEGTPEVESNEATQPDSASTVDTNKLKAVRDWGKNWKKQAKLLEKEAEELRAFKSTVETERRTNTAKAVFTELGLSEKVANLYLRIHEGDVDAESIKQFVVDYDLTPDTEGRGTTDEKTAGFEPGGPGETVAPGKKILDADEARALAASDPEALEKLVSEGKVRFEKLPGNLE